MELVDRRGNLAEFCFLPELEFGRNWRLEQVDEIAPEFARRDELDNVGACGGVGFGWPPVDGDVGSLRGLSRTSPPVSILWSTSDRWWSFAHRKTAVPYCRASPPTAAGAKTDTPLLFVVLPNFRGSIAVPFNEAGGTGASALIWSPGPSLAQLSIASDQ